MPVNKAARVRHEILDACLRTTGRKWTKQDLLERVNAKLSIHYGEDHSVSLSQLRYDLEDMQAEYGAPIECVREGRQVYYLYDDTDFSIQKVPIKEEDVEKLKDAVYLLKQISGFSLLEEVSELVQKLDRKIKFTGEQQGNYIEFETSEIVFGLEHLEDLYYSIVQKRVLTLHYKPFTHTETQRWIVHPYYLKQYNNRWYLFALYEETMTIGTYPLDRIKKITIANRSYIENTAFNSKSFFSNIVGVTLPENRQKEEIILEVSPSRAPYLITKPIHNSQQIASVYNDGSMILKLSLIVNPELISRLLSFGGDIIVKSPSHLAEELMIELQRGASAYQKQHYLS